MGADADVAAAIHSLLHLKINQKKKKEWRKTNINVSFVWSFGCWDRRLWLPESLIGSVVISLREYGVCVTRRPCRSSDNAWIHRAEQVNFILGYGMRYKYKQNYEMILHSSHHRHHHQKPWTEI